MLIRGTNSLENSNICKFKHHVKEKSPADSLKCWKIQHHRGPAASETLSANQRLSTMQIWLFWKSANTARSNMLALFQKSQICIVGSRWLADSVSEEADALWCWVYPHFRLSIGDFPLTWCLNLQMFEFTRELVPWINTQLGILIQPYNSIINSCRHG